MICQECSDNHFYGTHKKHTIQIERDHPDCNWYILVMAQDGSYVYNGWWRGSARKPVDKAIEEALKGSLLL